MKRCIKWGLIIGIPVLLLVILFGLYVAVVAGVDIPGLDSAFRAEARPLTAEDIAKAAAVEARIDEAVSGKSGFYVELTDADLTALLVREIGPDVNIRDLKAEVKGEQQEVAISASLNGRIGVPISGAIGATLVKGQVQLEVKRVNFTGLPLPSSAKQELESVVDNVLDVNELLRRAGAPLIQDLSFSDGKLAITGVQSEGADVAAVTKEAILEASAGGLRTPPVLPSGSDVVPIGRTGAESGADIYLAIGDSLAANQGVDDPREGYVSRFHAYMEGQLGRKLGLVNTGISGESTLSIYHSGQLTTALNELKQRLSDPATKVSVVTLDLGANDLMAHLNSDECHDDPRGVACQTRVNSAIVSFQQSFREVIELVSVELEPGAEFYVMTTYNPFSIGVGLPLEEFSNGVVERLNGVIRSEAEAVGAKVADPYPLMKENAGYWTHILEGDIHPTADGFKVLAYSFVQARQP